MTRAQLLPLLLVSLGSSLLTLAAGFVVATLVWAPTIRAAPDAQGPLPVLRAERVELVATDGTVRALLQVRDDGNTSLWFMDRAGQQRLGCGTGNPAQDLPNPGCFVRDAEGRVRLSWSVSSDSTFADFNIYSKNRTPLARLSAITPAPAGRIGAQVQAGPLRILGITPGSPAELAGLLAGDEIRSIDGQAASDLPVLAALPRLQGAVGSSVRLAIARPGTGGTSEVEIVRCELSPPSGTTGARLELMDEQGNLHLTSKVDGNSAPSIELLDANGDVTWGVR